MNTTYLVVSEEDCKFLLASVRLMMWTLPIDEEYYLKARNMSCLLKTKLRRLQ